MTTKVKKRITHREAQLMIVNTITRHFNYNSRRAWDIYSARNRMCPKCHADVNEACLNMSPHAQPGTINRQPHEERKQYALLLQGLVTRGYATEAEVVAHMDKLKRRYDVAEA